MQSRGIKQLKNPLKVKIHYPEAKGEILELQKNAGSAYLKFLRNYIRSMPIGDREKNRLYSETIGYLTGKRVDCL